MAYSFLLATPAAPPPERFDTNMAGCGIIRTALEAVAVLDIDTDHPEFPAWPPPGVSAEKTDAIWFSSGPEAAIDQVLSQREAELWRAQEAVEEAVLSRRSPTTGRVPTFKFESNDSWHVVPEECCFIVSQLTPALALLEQARGPLTELSASREGRGDSSSIYEFLSDFVAFCTHAAAFGGFRVA